MIKIEIKIKECAPDVKNPRASVKQRDEFEWKNQNAFDVTVVFDRLNKPIFDGYEDSPEFKLPAHGSITVRLRPDAPPGNYDYSITSANCKDEISPDTIIVDP